VIGDSEEEALEDSEDEIFEDSEPDLWDLIKISESARWPLQAGYPGLAIKNLPEYLSLFSHCLVNIQNYQGIEIIGIKSPVYITRYDVAYLKMCYRPFPDKPMHYGFILT